MDILDTTLPLENPVLKFLVILVIILLVPIFLNKIRIPQLLGLIVVGAFVGPHGINLIERDSGIILSGTAGLLYIMFLAGIEIDLADFKKNSRKSVIFGLYTFVVPMVLGTLAGLYVLEYSLPTSVLMASMFASHTLIAYPLISKLGVAKNQAVNITVGGTMITDTLALLVLAVIVGSATGEADAAYWIQLTLSILAFGAVVLLTFPPLGRWFLKTFDDSISQYIFMLTMVFLGATLAELAGLEAIIGAFLAGLALNRLVPATSPLMNRVEFVGNAIFIPFFLIGVGMLIDYRAFFEGTETIKVAGVMIVVASAAKFIAALLTQKTFNYNADERRVIFGLSNAQAAATLAAVLVGYNTILGEGTGGAPIRLLSESVLNGTILMILFTCTLASFVAQKGAKNLALAEEEEEKVQEQEVGDYDDEHERILIPVSNFETVEELVQLGITLKSAKNTEHLYALCVVDSKTTDEVAQRQANKLLTRAAVVGSATDTEVQQLLRYDLNRVNGITNAAREHGISDIVIGLHQKRGFGDSFLGKVTEGIIAKSSSTVIIYRSVQPMSTLKRHHVIVPRRAEREPGFALWLLKVWNMGRNLGSKLIFHATPQTLAVIRSVHKRHPIECTFEEFVDWNDFLIVARDLQPNDSLVVNMSRKGYPSYHSSMSRVPGYMNSYFNNNNLMLIYPAQEGAVGNSNIDLMDSNLSQSIVRLDEIAKSVTQVFRRK